MVPHPVDADDAALVDAFRRTLGAVDVRGQRAALVIVDHITSPTGTVLPVEQVCALARSAGALSFVDAAHVPGHLPQLHGELPRRIFASALQDHDVAAGSGQAGGGDAAAVPRAHDRDVDLGEDLLGRLFLDERLDGLG